MYFIRDIYLNNLEIWRAGKIEAAVGSISIFRRHAAGTRACGLTATIHAPQIKIQGCIAEMGTSPGFSERPSRRPGDSWSRKAQTTPNLLVMLPLSTIYGYCNSSQPSPLHRVS